MNDKQKISDEGDLRKYRTELPNLYDDSDLTPYEFRLLAHYKRVGLCYEGTRTTAKKCRMSTGKVSECRQSLATKGFIKLEKVDKKDGTYYFNVTVKDMWAENFTRYTRSLSEHPRSPDEQTRSLSETKKEPIKKEPRATGADKPRREPTDDQKELAHLETLFCELTGRSAPARSTIKERKAAGEMWWQPLRHIRDQANGQSDKVLKLAVQKMRADNLTIYSPKSVEKTAIALLAEMPRQFQTAAPADPYASLQRYLNEKNQ